jgi:4-hydroxy-3-methylbut-2-en-1-yl diphosphate synthase IspG/GcpE
MVVNCEGLEVCLTLFNHRYVGTLPGKIDLYVGKEVVRRNIDEAVAVDALIQLIKDNDRWKEKEEVC